MISNGTIALGTEGTVRSLRMAAICAGLAAIFAFMPFVQNASLYLVVAALGMAVILPVWFDWVHGRLDYFAPVHAIGFVIFLYFGMGAIWTVGDPSRVAYDLHVVPFIPLAALYGLLGYLAFLAGYFGPWRSRAPAQRNAERPRGVVFMISTGIAGLAGLVAVGWWDVASRRGIALPVLVATLSQLWPLFLFSWGLAWAVIFSGTSSRNQRLFILGGLCPAVMLAGYLTFSDKSLAITLVAIPVVARWYMKRKIPWTFLLVLLLILIFIVFPLYNTFRWFDAGIGRAERVGMAYETIRGWDSENFLRFSLGSFKTRLAMINSLAIVIRDTPRWIPWAHGETIFLPAFAFFIPRALWADKPIEESGLVFGRTFRVTNVYTRDTHIGPTIPGELYWNFGLPGILVGMAALGAFVRFLYRRYVEGGQTGPVQVAMHIVLLVSWVHFMGGSIAGSLVGIIRTIILLEMLRWLGRNYGLLSVGNPK